MKALAPFALIFALIGSAAGAVTLSNTPTGGSVAPFGTPDTQTYGQVFVAPVTGTLDDFTLYLDGGVGDLVGAIGTWNGTATHGFGFGSDTTLYTSAVTGSVSGGNTFATGGISVTAGSIYVAFLTVFGLGNPDATTTMPLGSALTGGGYFVWNNTSDPFGNTSWNYFFDIGSAQFEANFTPTAAVPVPAALPLMLLALGGLGVAARRRRT